jgi:hypothetical protein
MVRLASKNDFRFLEAENETWLTTMRTPPARVWFCVLAISLDSHLFEQICVIRRALFSVTNQLVQDVLSHIRHPLRLEDDVKQLVLRR